MSQTREVLSNERVKEFKLKCSYCDELIDDENYLYCLQCHGHVHVRCLRHSSTPGDLLGDVFFDFTCAKCMQMQYDGPSTSTGCAKEKFVRQRLPWILVITLALYNLSIKSKGLSHHGYFHWRTHVVNFIEKNWDYLFEPNVKKRKQWIGSVTGNMSHNSPDFFQSGQEKFGESGWWKLTHENKHPRYIYSLYEQFSQKRSQMRNGKKENDESDLKENFQRKELPNEVKRLRTAFVEEDILSTYSFSRAIPYMGRQPKLSNNLKNIEENLNPVKKVKPDPEPLSTVQSSLMDFLAESLATDDLNLFQNLPNIAAEPLVSEAFEKSDYLLSTFSEVHENGDANNEDTAKDLKPQNHQNSFGYNYGFDQLKTFYKQIEDEDTSQDMIHVNKLDDNSIIDPTLHGSEDLSTLVKIENSDILSEANWVSEELQSEENSKSDSNIEDDDVDDGRFQARVVQVTNFQQLNTDPKNLQIKLENHGDNDAEDKNETEEAIKSAVDNIKNEIQVDDVDEDTAESTINDTPLLPCKPSLFTKHHRRELPWLATKKESDIKTSLHQLKETSDKPLEIMSVFEERSLLQKLKEIFTDEQADKLHLPSYLRRFYRKLCVREQKRQHNKPIFDLDSSVTGQPTPISTKYPNPTSNIIDRYQMISISIPKATTSFYTRITGSYEPELFQSPFSGRILHPFIFRNSECLPPWLKLMLHLQYCVTGDIAVRHPIDFCYLRPNHIAAVNVLLESLFWPGIDMTECLSYPDHTVVALYKKLVIGCGFLVPDSGYNEAYISFMGVRPGWQRSGIATFMLYHLIQTCMTKDITLHVSATNPAVLLYQKFGFKIEDIVLDFYDKYLPLEPKETRTALYLRLSR